FLPFNRKITSIFLIGLTLFASCSKNDTPVTPPSTVATIASVTGPTGLTSGPKNTIITITGTNFITNLAQIQVKVNGKICTVLSATATTITAQIPPACGTGIVELFLNGTRYAGPVFNFVYSYTVISINNGQTGYLDGPVSTAKIEEIVGITIDANDNIYTAQYNYPRVRKFTRDSLVGTMAGDGTMGAVNGNGTSAKLGFADFVSSDAAGNVYLAEDYNGTSTVYIRKIDVNKNVTYFASSPYGLQGIKVMPSGNIYIHGFNRIGKVSPAGVITWLIVSNGSGDLDGAAGTAKFKLYGNIEVSTDETKIYVTDMYNGQASGGKIKLYDVTANTITTIAGKTGLSDGDGPALNVGFTWLSCLLLDNTGGLYIADRGSNKIKYLKNGNVTTYLGFAGGGDVDGDISTAKISLPHGIVFDSRGNMYISCYVNNKLKKVIID
ncbi:MAG: IPT/TIG domain-containing protein, partial [Ferruginibacter sp.]